MLLFSPRWLFAVPGTLLILVGVAALVSIAVGEPARINGIGLSVNTALAAAMTVILGSQLLLTGIFARALTSQVGLLPPTRWLERTAKVMTLERGLAVGILVSLFGFALLGAAGLAWRATGFGTLDTALTLRCVIPAMTMVILGAQVAFYSFLIGLISLIVEHRKEAQ